MAEKKELRMTLEASTVSVIAKYADKNELSVSEAVDKLIATAASRLAALARYAKNTKADAKPAPKKKAKKKAKSTANGAAAHA